MIDKRVFESTAKILSYSRKGLNAKALSCFLQMRKSGDLEPNAATLSATLAAAVQSHSFGFGLGLHTLILKLGFAQQLFVASGLITFYSKLSWVEGARNVFDEMPERDSVIWNSMISAYARVGSNDQAVGLFSSLTWGDTKRFVNDFTLTSVLKACAGAGYLRLGQSVHGYSVKNMCYDSTNVFVGGAIVDMYCKCGRLDGARRVFGRMRERDVVVWNAIISGCVINGCECEAIQLYYKMASQGFLSNDSTLSSVLNASVEMDDSALGQCFHGKALKYGFFLDVYVGTAVVDMYAKFLSIDEAERAFDEMVFKNVVSYNALISGYSLVGGSQKALEAYTMLRLIEMEADSCTFTSLFSCCASTHAFRAGIQVHSHVMKFGLGSDMVLVNSIVNFYLNCGFVDSALEAFHSVGENNNIVSWTTIISGLAQNNKGEKALEMFREMHARYGKADEFSSSSAIKSATTQAAIEQGRHLHAHVIKLGLEWQLYVGSALIDMYAKCGMVEDACKIFHEIPEKNSVCWNSIIIGCAQNGLAAEALQLFQEMKDQGIIPTPVTYVGVLLSCSRVGFVDKGKQYYKSMVHDYNITPSIEHCTCMVNLLGHSGLVNEAVIFLLDSPFSQDPGLWRSLLASCEAHGNLEVGSQVAERCLELEGSSVSSTYTILSNIYAAKELWPEVTKMRDSMMAAGIEKVPGFSRIEARS